MGGEGAQKIKYNPLEMLGAILSGLGLPIIIITGGRALGLSVLVLAFGFIIWKIGEMKRELESLRNMVESIKSSIGDLNARDLEG